MAMALHPWHRRQTLDQTPKPYPLLVESAMGVRWSAWVTCSRALMNLPLRVPCLAAVDGLALRRVIPLWGVFPVARSGCNCRGWARWRGGAVAAHRADASGGPPGVPPARQGP